MQDTNNSPVRILRGPEVRARIGLSRSSLYNYIQRGLFPPPIKLGPRCVGWMEEDVVQWIVNRQSASESKSARRLN
jgi:prophage regulatory protein